MPRRRHEEVAVTYATSARQCHFGARSAHTRLPALASIRPADNGHSAQYSDYTLAPEYLQHAEEVTLGHDTRL